MNKCARRVIRSLDDPHSVVAVLMDNATRSSWKLIEEACPWVVCGACMPHVVDLTLEDIGKLPFVKEVLEDVGDVRNFVRDHSHVLAAFNQNPAKKGSLGRPGATRFGTSVLGIWKMLPNRAALASTLVDDHVTEAMERAKGSRLVSGKHQTLGDLYKWVKNKAR